MGSLRRAICAVSGPYDDGSIRFEVGRPRATSKSGAQLVLNRKESGRCIVETILTC